MPQCHGFEKLYTTPNILDMANIQSKAFPSWKVLVSSYVGVCSSLSCPMGKNEPSSVLFERPDFAWNWHQLKHTLWYTLDTNNGGTSGTSTWRRICHVSRWIIPAACLVLYYYILSRILNIMKGRMLYLLGFPKVLYRMFPHVCLQNTSIYIYASLSE